MRTISRRDAEDDAAPLSADLRTRPSLDAPLLSEPPPQLDFVAAFAALALAEQTILTYPESAARFEVLDRVREYHIRGTPFSLLYAITPDEVLVIDIRDARGQRSADILRKFLRDLSPSLPDT